MSNKQNSLLLKLHPGEISISAHPNQATHAGHQMTEMHKWPPAKKLAQPAASSQESIALHCAFCVVSTEGHPFSSAIWSRGSAEKSFTLSTMLIQRINLHRVWGKDRVKTGWYVSNDCHIADAQQDWSCSSKSQQWNLGFWGFGFIPTVWIYNVPPNLKMIFKKGLLTSGLVSMLKQAPAAAFKPLTSAVQLTTKNNW